MFLRLLFLLFTLFIVEDSFAQKTKPESIKKDTVVRKLVVGYKMSPPFIIIDDNNLSGVSVELWETIARELGYVYEYKKYESTAIEQMITDVQNGVIDISINPTTVTSERIKRVDFTQPFYLSSLAIALPVKNSNKIMELISNIFSSKFWKAVLALFFILLILGTIVWIIEKRANKEQFRKGIKGIGDGVWWAATTMTTVGYGDLAPKTFVGRLIATIWMFSAIVVISGLTGSIAASLTANEIKYSVNTVADLNKIKVGTIKGSSSEDFLLRNNVVHFKNNFTSVEKGLEALATGKIAAFVYDEPIIRYYLKDERFENITILDKRFSVDYLSFSMQKGDKMLKDINQALITELEKISWLGILHTYQLSR